jgi:hypothetical protein
MGRDRLRIFPSYSMLYNIRSRYIDSMVGVKVVKVSSSLL